MFVVADLLVTAYTVLIFLNCVYHINVIALLNEIHSVGAGMFGHLYAICFAICFIVCVLFGGSDVVAVWICNQR